MKSCLVSCLETSVLYSNEQNMRKTTFIILTLMFCATSFFGQRTYMELKDVSKVPSELNSDAEESLPLYSPDGRLYFVRTLHDGNIGGKMAGQDIWYTQLEDSTHWSSPTNNIDPLNNVFNNGVVGVADSGRTLYLNGTYSNKFEYQLGLSVSKFEEGEWSRPKRIRIKGFNPKSPYLTFHVNDEAGIMVMSYGSKDDPKNEDLYVSFREKDFTWSKPKSLGIELNTDSAEFSPFLSDDGRTLYFSSNGHGGLGGVDVFVTTRLDETWQYWSRPSNLGEPINSGAFDAYYTQFGTEAFFSSNRESSLSDLYRAEYEILLREDEPLTMADDRMANERLFSDQFALTGFIEQLDGASGGTEIRILDKNGDVVKTMKPEKDGSFQLGGMSQNSKYYLDIANEDNLDIFIVNSDGDRVYLNKDLASGTYPFETLKRDIRAVLVADVVVEDGGLKATHFAFDGNEPIPAGSSIYLKDEYNKRQETVVVNRNGEFEFKTMQSSKSYSIEFEDGTLDVNSRIFIVEEDGNRMEVSGNILKGALFKKVKGALVEVEEEAPLASVEQPEVKDEPAIVTPEPEKPKTTPLKEDVVEDVATFGFESESQPPAGTKMKLIDTEGNVVEEAITDAEGLFQFEKLDADKQYSIQMDKTADQGKKDFSMYIVNNEGIQRPLAQDVAKGAAFKGGMVKSTEAKEEEEVFTFDYSALPPAGSMVYLTDDNNNIVDSAVVGSDGRFKFKKLDPSKDYLMRIGADDDYSKGLDFFVLNEEGKQFKMGNEEKEGDRVTTSTQEAIAAAPKVEFEQFAFDVANKPQPGSIVYLTDANGNTVDSSFVDMRGNFRFRKLDPTQSYMFEVDDDQFDMGNAQLYAMENGRKRKLTKLEHAFAVQGMDLIAEEDSKLNVNEFLIEYEGEDAPTQAYLYDEETNTIIDTADINPEDGTFSFRKLKSEKKYSLKFDEEVDMSKAKLFTVDEGSEKEEVTSASDEGFAVVTPKAVKIPPVKDEPVAVVEEPEIKQPPVVKEAPKAEKPEEKKEVAVVTKDEPKQDEPVKPKQEKLSEIKGEWVVYFGFNEFLLAPDQLAYLRKNVISSLSKDDKLEIIVEGHTDNVGGEDVNYRMSVLRVSNVLYHLEMHGIEDTRMTAIPKGETTPVATNDTEEGRSKNRRVEIRIKKN